MSEFIFARDELSMIFVTKLRHNDERGMKFIRIKDIEVVEYNLLKFGFLIHLDLFGVIPIVSWISETH